MKIIRSYFALSLLLVGNVCAGEGSKALIQYQEEQFSELQATVEQVQALDQQTNLLLQQNALVPKQLAGALVIAGAAKVLPDLLPHAARGVSAALLQQVRDYAGPVLTVGGFGLGIYALHKAHTTQQQLTVQAAERIKYAPALAALQETTINLHAAHQRLAQEHEVTKADLTQSHECHDFSLIVLSKMKTDLGDMQVAVRRLQNDETLATELDVEAAVNAEINARQSAVDSLNEKIANLEARTKEELAKKKNK